VFELIISGSLLFLLDQSTKKFVQTSLLGCSLARGRFLQIRQVAHRKEFYSHTAGRTALILIWIGALASVLWLRWYGTWFQHPIEVAGLGCALGGAAGNLTDILRQGYVLDFVDLGWWPVFNVADIGIVGGLLAAFWY
jgi:signal peptidase II